MTYIKGHYITILVSENETTTPWGQSLLFFYIFSRFYDGPKKSWKWIGEFGLGKPWKVTGFKDPARIAEPPVRIFYLISKSIEKYHLHF